MGVAEWLQSIKPTVIKKLEKALEPPEKTKQEQKNEEEKRKSGIWPKPKPPTAAETRKKQGPGFWMGDIGEDEPKKPEHYKKGNPKKMNVGF